MFPLNVSSGIGIPRMSENRVQRFRKKYLFFFCIKDGLPGIYENKIS